MFGPPVPHRRRRRNQSADRDLESRSGQFVVVAGKVLGFVAETDRDAANVDHFWITIDAGKAGRLEISLSTFSKRNRDAGFDGRMRVAIISSPWETLPDAGLRPGDRLDYGELEAQTACTFSIYERPAVEQLLEEKTRQAILVEAWGELYVRRQNGIHQVHSRRASCSVARDIVGRDGAIRFYFAEERRSEMLLFRYCGQA
jgi:hypothetical protein